MCVYIYIYIYIGSFIRNPVFQHYALSSHALTCALLAKTHTPRCYWVALLLWGFDYNFTNYSFRL